MGYRFAYGYWPSVTVVVVICCTVWTNCCTPAPAGIVSLVVVMRLPPWLAYMDTETWTESSGEVGGTLKPSCPLNCIPPFTDDKSVLAVPRPVFDVASYALPVAYSWVP